MKRIQPFLSMAAALVCLSADGAAAEPPVPAQAPRAEVEIQVQGNAQLLLNGAGQIQVQADAVNVRAVAPSVAPPVIFFPGIPSILLPNPAAAEAKPGYLGVQLETDEENQAEGDDAKKDAAKRNAGVGIANVVEGSPAEKAGLKLGDRVLKFEGKDAGNSTKLREMIRAIRPQQQVKLTVRRDGKEVEVKATLAAAPEPAAGAVLQLNGMMIGGGNEPQAVPGVVVFNRTNLPSISSVIRSGGVPADMDTVSLRDGNRFIGKIRGISPAKGLVLQREGQPELELIEKEISGLTFAERRKDEPASAGSRPKVVVQLRDGGMLHGDALTMEQGKLLVTLTGGQRVEIPRAHVHSAMLSDADAPQIYDGPLGLAGWVGGRFGQGQWEFADGLLRCIQNGPIGRDFARLPDPLDLSFDVVFPPNMQHFSATLFATAVNQSGVGTLTMNLSPQQIYGSHYDGRRYNQYNTNLDAPQRQVFNTKPEAVRYRFLVDRVNGRALIYIGGVKRAEWKLSKVKPEDLGKCGAVFSISPNVSMSGTTFQVGRVRILPWDGKEPAKEGEMRAPAGDQALASDGKSTGGEIVRIGENEIVFANPAATVRREKSLFVRFAGPAEAKDLPVAAARVQLRNGSEFTASKVQGDGEALTLTMRSGSQIALPLSMLRELEFLPPEGQADPTASGVDVITLTDGTQLRGKAITPVSGDKLRWSIAAVKSPLEYPSASVAGIFFSRAAGAEKAAALAGESVVRLSNGDWLPCDAVALEANRFLFRTALAPEIAVPLSDLSAIYLNPRVAASVNDGSSGPTLWSEGWKPNQYGLVRQTAKAAAKSPQPWAYHDGGYTLTGPSRGGETMLAQRWTSYSGAYALNFDITNPNRGPAFSLQVFNSKDERTFSVSVSGGRVYVYFNPSTARLARFAAGGKRFQVDGKIENSGGTTPLSIVLDRPARTFRVFMAGKEIGKIPFKADEADEALDAGGMSLAPSYYSSTSTRRNQNRVERIWLAPWEGMAKAPLTSTDKGAAEKAGGDAQEAEAKKESGPQPTIYLANGDEFSGAIGKITSEIVSVDSDAGPLDLPGKRVAWIRFPSSPATGQDQYPRLRFHDRGVLTVKDLEIGSERVKCRTLQGQALDFPLSLVKEAVWHPLSDK